MAMAAPDRQPDIVVYLADDLSAADLPLYGGSSIATPAITALAADGLTFDHAFVASPSCAPSRAALLTGLMPARNGAEENHTFPREGTLRLPRLLNELGYHTAAFGKVAHARSAQDYGFETIDLSSNIPQVRRAVRQFLQTRDDPRPLALFVGVSNPHVPWPAESSVDPQQLSLPAIRQTLRSLLPAVLCFCPADHSLVILQRWFAMLPGRATSRYPRHFLLSLPS